VVISALDLRSGIQSVNSRPTLKWVSGEECYTQLPLASGVGQECEGGTLQGFAPFSDDVSENLAR